MELKTALKELAEDVKKEILRRLHSSVGINYRAGRNTLVGSDLEASISVSQSDENTIVFEIADYYEYVVQGRKAGWKNRPPKPPGIIYGITKWVRKKGIHFQGLTETQTIWTVLEALEVRAIAARPFIQSGQLNGEDPSKILPFLDSYFDAWADDVFKLITDKIDKYF